MERTISVTRIYNLGDYKSIRISDTFSDIPEELFTNTESMRILRELQMLQVDSAYFEYVKNSLTFKEGVKPEEALKLINQAKAPLTEELKEASASLNTQE